MCCDFRLTNPYTGTVTQRDAHKLVTVSRFSISALIGVTGVAFLDGKPVGQWIAEAMATSGENASITDISDALRLQAGAVLSKITDRRVRRTTFVIASMIGTQSMVTLVSNFEAIEKGRIRRAALADADMTVSSTKPKAASFFAAGEADKITSAERDRLRLSLRAGVSDSRIHEKLRQVNEAVSRRTNDTVSIGCYTASLHATGTGSSQSFLTDEQSGSFIPPETTELWNRLGLRFNPQIGPDGRSVPVRLVQSGSVVIGASPEYFREQFKLQSGNAELWNNYGNFLRGRRHSEKAIEAYRKAIELNPAYAIALSNLAAMLWDKGDIAEAEQLYVRAVAASEPSVPAVVLSDFATFCDEALSQTQRAALLHERAASDENFPLARARQALFILKHENESDQANPLLAQALARQPENPQVLYLAGKADWFYNKDSAAALAKLHKACSLDPRDVNVLGMAAYAAMKSGDSASAAYYCRKLLKVFPTAEVQANYAMALLMEGKPEGALRHLSKAARFSPGDRMTSIIRTIRAATLWVLRRHDEAIALMHTILNTSLPPEIELEVLGMLHWASPTSASDTNQRIRQLIESGVRGDGYTIRSMVRNKPRSERDSGYRLADIIEGMLEFPPSL
jgi:Flp pilus assembly protein TadD